MFQPVFQMHFLQLFTAEKPVFESQLRTLQRPLGLPIAPLKNLEKV